MPTQPLAACDCAPEHDHDGPTRESELGEVGMKFTGIVLVFALLRPAIHADQAGARVPVLIRGECLLLALGDEKTNGRLRKHFARAGRQVDPVRAFARTFVLRRLVVHRAGPRA